MTGQLGRLSYSALPGSVRWIDLACLLEMFLSQLTHSEVLQSAPKHPMVNGIVGSELVGLFFISAGFFEFT